MEVHRVLDCGFDPKQRAFWIKLDGQPSRVWRERLQHQLVGPDGLDCSPVPVVAGHWAYLDTAHLDELDAFTLLTAHVDAANDPRMMPTSGP